MALKKILKKESKCFRLLDWDGKEHYITAEDLFNRVQNDSKSDFNWISSADQLYNTVHIPEFPQKYAEGIMLLILNCFANLELRKTERYFVDEDSDLIVHKIYNELSSTDATTIKIKEKYLKNFIHAVTIYDDVEVRCFLPGGETFAKLCAEWEENKFLKYSKEENLDFNQLYTFLMDEFESFIEDARKDENVIEEDAKERDNINGFLVNIFFKE